jgi:hypothetical protein
MKTYTDPDPDRKADVTAALPFHPAADIFPLMQGRDFEDLVGDIKRRGLHVPVITHKGIEARARKRLEGGDARDDGPD